MVAALLLALAIPLQGAASVTAGICMATGHHDAPAPASHGHGHGADDAASHFDHEGASHDGGSHCAPCVACCAAATIAPADPISLPHSPPAAALAALPFLPPGSLPEKIDRPPLAL